MPFQEVFITRKEAVKVLLDLMISMPPDETGETLDRIVEYAETRAEL